MEGTHIHFQPDRYLLVGQFLFLAAGFGRKVRYVWQNRLSFYMTQERYIKVNLRLRTTAPFKAAPYIVDRISILCQMVVVTMLDYMVNDLQCPLETAWNWFLTSNASRRFEIGDGSVLAGTSGVELARQVLEQTGEPVPTCEASYSYDRSPEYWTGWAIAYYLWETGLSFSEINQAVPINDVRMLYSSYLRKSRKRRRNRKRQSLTRMLIMWTMTRTMGTIRSLRTMMQIVPLTKMIMNLCKQDRYDACGNLRVAFT